MIIRYKCFWISMVILLFILTSCCYFTQPVVLLKRLQGKDMGNGYIIPESYNIFYTPELSSVDVRFSFHSYKFLNLSSQDITVSQGQTEIEKHIYYYRNGYEEKHPTKYAKLDSVFITEGRNELLVGGFQVPKNNREYIRIDLSTDNEKVQLFGFDPDNAIAYRIIHTDYMGMLRFLYERNITCGNENLSSLLSR